MSFLLSLPPPPSETAVPLIQAVFSLKATTTTHFAHTPQPCRQPPSFTTAVAMATRSPPPGTATPCRAEDIVMAKMKGSDIPNIFWRRVTESLIICTVKREYADSHSVIYRQLAAGRPSASHSELKLSVVSSCGFSQPAQTQPYTQ